MCRIAGMQGKHANLPTPATTMKLSVVIVNYNVKAYLEQCLRTVYEALKGMEGEVFVVDNQSTDGSVEMVQREFPGVHLVANQQNMGFSRANNQAIRQCRGEYILLLNPDTVVGEDVFHKVMAFMDANPKAGGLGVKMIDGTGRFLPESKRGLPTPTVAFYKIIGLSRLFPNSKSFGRYHLGHLPEDETAPIEILSGACMFLRRSVLDEVGLLDESFFMYGEDIDLSYRIRLGGYENWYFPQARIIHYKGESTKKSSVNYVFVFYNAMVIFARKHFTRRGPQLFSAIIRGAIYLSAAAAIGMRFLHHALLPLLDLAIVYLCLSLFPGMGPETGPWHHALLGLVGIGAMAVAGNYDVPGRWTHVAKGIGALALVVLAARPWLHSEFMEAILLVASAAALMIAVRAILRLFNFRIGASPVRERTRILAIGSPNETKPAMALLWQTHYGLDKEVLIDPRTTGSGELRKQILRAVKEERLREVVFSARDMPMDQVIALMGELKTADVIFKIAQPGAKFIIGPGTTESVNDLLVLPDHAVSSSAPRRHRRALDIVLAVALLVTAPVGIWWIPRKQKFLGNCMDILTGRSTWVGYGTSVHDRRLPPLRPSVLSPTLSDGLPDVPLITRRANLEYAKDYRMFKDLRRVLTNYRLLGT